METPPFPETRIGVETDEDANHGEINWVAQCSVGTVVLELDEEVAQ